MCNTLARLSLSLFLSALYISHVSSRDSKSSFNRTPAKRSAHRMQRTDNIFIAAPPCMRAGRRSRIVFDSQRLATFRTAISAPRYQGTSCVARGACSECFPGISRGNTYQSPFCTEGNGKQSR